MVRISLFAMCRCCSQYVHVDAEVDDKTGRLVDFLSGGETKPPVLVDEHLSWNEPKADVFFTDSCPEDFGIDWLCGSGKKHGGESR